MFLIFRHPKRISKIRIKSSRRRKPDTLWKKHIPEALSKITRIIGEINNAHSNTFTYNRISVRNQKTRWGSCSSKNNLNFNYKVVFLPDNLTRYLIIHELCHLKYLNHSKEYWGLVKSIFPGYKKVQKELKTFKVIIK